MYRRTPRPVRVAAACLACAAVIGPVAPAALAAPAAGPPDRSTIQGCAPPPGASDPAIPWAQQQFFPQRVWKVTRGSGVVVAVVDSGVDANSPQLAGAVLSGVDVSGSGGATSDCTGQGTFVAGIIAARQVHGVGFAGLAPDARILPVRVLDDKGNADPAMLAKGIRAAADAGARVINVSPSTSVPSAALQAAVEYAQSRDALVVAAAAASTNGRSATYPAAYDGVLGVGGINETGKPSAASETGFSVDVVAPGEEIVSIGPGGPGHWQASGTAYATPFVSAAAALVRAYHPELTAVQVAERLRTTANRSGGAVPDPQTGWGVVNPYSAVTGVVTGVANSTVTSGRVTHPVVPPPDPWPAGIVAATTGAAVGAGALGWLISVLVPAGRRRSWHLARGARTTGEAPEF